MYCADCKHWELKAERYISIEGVHMKGYTGKCCNVVVNDLLLVIPKNVNLYILEETNTETDSMFGCIYHEK